MHAWTNMVGACIYIFERTIRLSENRHRSRAAPIPCDVSSLLLLLLPSDLCFTETEILAPFSQIPSPKKPFNRVPRSGVSTTIFSTEGNGVSKYRPGDERKRGEFGWRVRFLRRESKARFWGPHRRRKRERAHQRPHVSSNALPSSLSFPLLPSFSCFSRCRASAPKTRLYRAGCDWSVDPVIHRKRRMQTVT